MQFAIPLYHWRILYKDVLYFLFLIRTKEIDSMIAASDDRGTVRHGTARYGEALYDWWSTSRLVAVVGHRHRIVLRIEMWC